MQIRAEEISQIIRKEIDGFDQKVAVNETGTVLEAGDGIARVYGLESAMAGELLDFGHNVVGLVLNLEEDNVGVALLGDYEHVREGDTVKRTGKIAQVPVGDALIGRVVNTTGLGPHRLANLPRPPWFFERAKYGGILTDIASHQCEQFLFFADSNNAEIVAATVANRSNPQTPELQDFGELLLSTASLDTNGII